MDRGSGKKVSPRLHFENKAVLRIWDGEKYATSWQHKLMFLENFKKNGPI